MKSSRRGAHRASEKHAANRDDPSALIDGRIAELADWRGELLATVREVIVTTLPEVVEQWKWRGVPSWFQDGIICTGETYRDKVKITFAKGAFLPDPSRRTQHTVTQLEMTNRRPPAFRA